MPIRVYVDDVTQLPEEVSQETKERLAIIQEQKFAETTMLPLSVLPQAFEGFLNPNGCLGSTKNK